MAPLVRTPPVSERLVLIPAISKNSTTGFKNVSYDRSRKKFQVQVRDGDKRVHLGCFDTAEEAATAYARSEYGRADAAKQLQPRAAPTAAGAAAILQAAREGLTLTASSGSNSGYKGVTFYPKEQGRKKYQLKVTVGGKSVGLGMFATAEQAALFSARREAGRDTGSDLTAPPPPPPPPEPSSAAGAEAVRQAEREGLTLATSSSSSGYRGVYYRPKQEGSKKYQLSVTVGGKQLHLGYFATAEQAALFSARREAGRDTGSDLTAPPPPPPPPAPSSVVGAEAVQQAGREGLTLATSSSSNSGYKGVYYHPKQKGSKKYELKVSVGGQPLYLGMFATAEQAALFYARREAGRDTSDLTAPPPPPPPPAPSSAAGAEAVRQAGR
ncbi:hypothetical protein EMIHUDRAFT_110392 [Emiliania huxleyi CCMP1516]|uniref:AP2/ERF domain-containing protein n=2 Tax=Emiliania huxleyi TaxID=2903 RepID=A0A0D3KK66_EMIH1|nr:hypothetical protein EMIHUDRAFT_110392 [Emiliania huxleyi CCMP1516]EOD36151.1 hypothetical protein EMIHUDRAFT_110392 [Emiliania huxleyi CCMP1516]|eukprot:XP_005788580.1 hypothetical protein EMIHUDRAFT_110392 [Emiliania huxleyi CCMP1516]